MWLTDRERLTLTILGALALAGLGVNVWQQQRPMLRSEARVAPPYAEWERLAKQAKQVNLNRASATELERLPEVGPSLAERIVAYRDAHGAFASPEDLLHVPGIGPKTLDVLKDYVAVE